VGAQQSNCLIPTRINDRAFAMEEVYIPILDALASKYNADVFTYVLDRFQDENVDMVIQKTFNMAHFFIIAESDLWDIFHGKDATLIYHGIRNRLQKGKTVSKKGIEKRLSSSGYNDEEDIFQSKISALIFIKIFISEYENKKRTMENE
jgi:hypothetical protein